jgi:hypothetical protein
MMAIETRYLGPTNSRGSRIKATADAGSVTVPYDHALSSTQNHAKAAQALAMKFGWTGSWVGGGLPNSSGYAFAPVKGERFVVSAAAKTRKPARRR